MKKLTLAAWFLVLFGFYVAYEKFGTSQAIVLAPTGQNQAPAVTSTPATVPTANPSTKSTQASASPSTPAPAPKPIGQYKDGTYTGGSADAYYGSVQVEAIIQGGKIAGIKFLDYPQSHQVSVYINSQAMPYLTQEAIQAQNANVNIISGATFTSQAFIQSLASALAQAKNS